jgi:prephenate dehydrogenase
MDESDFLTPARVAILGLGLMGGSLAMALRGKCASLLGIDPDPETLAMARRLQIVDRVASQPDELLPEADVLILATPVRVIMTLLDELPSLQPGPAIVIDLGSTKVDILRAMAALPDRFDPVGGHPMCGKERSSLANAEAGLFRGAPFAFTPLPRSTPHGRGLATQLARALGAEPLWLDAETHDRWVGATSHLPYLVANTLAAVVPVDAAPMVGTGLSSTTRLAPSPLNVMRDILMTNRENVLANLRRFQARLDILEKRLAVGDEQGLSELLDQGRLNYEKLVGYRTRGN